MVPKIGWLVGSGFNGPLRQYFSLYRAVSHRGWSGGAMMPGKLPVSGGGGGVVGWCDGAG